VTFPISVTETHVARPEAAGYRHRAMTALLDVLVLYTMITLIRISWLVIAQPRGAVQNEPPLVSALNLVVIGLYVLATTALGRTLGMLATGLRIVRSDDGGALGPLRALSRSVVLLLATGLLAWVHPSLVVVYSLWMLFSSRHQMLHDQIAGTVVIRMGASVATHTTDGDAAPSLVGLEPPQAQALLDDLDLVRRRARGDLHMVSVPMFALALISVGYAVAGWDTFGGIFGLLFGALAGPLSLLLTAGWLHRDQRRQGLGAGVGPLWVITIFVMCTAVVSGFFPIGGAVTAIGFFALAISQHSRVLATAAVIFGLVAGAEQPMHAISNGVINHFPAASAVDLFQYHGSAIVFAMLALLLLGASAAVLRQEQSDD
jgi:uncharacterized RDD family membrane protein YckC